MTKRERLEHLAIQIHYAQSRMVNISVDDWIKKLEALNEPEDKKRIEAEQKERDRQAGLEGGIYAEKRIEEIEVKILHGEDKMFIAEKINECIRAINKINNK